MATGRVAAPEDEQHDEDQDDRESDGTEHLHPEWGAGARAASGFCGVLGRVYARAAEVVGHMPILQDTVSSKKHDVSYASVRAYAPGVPKLWNDTIEAHRRDVRNAIMEATVALVAEHGLRSVTMSQIAEKTGIGRATLYKYFPRVEAILVAWHELQVAGHLERLVEVRERAGDGVERLEAVLEAYALILHETQKHHDTELSAFVHRDEHVVRAQHRLREVIRELLTAGAATGEVRDDVGADELASYCLHALAAAGSLPSKPAVRRLVAVTLTGLRPGDRRSEGGIDVQADVPAV
jgi:AcrR family transcriptional regulator